MIRRGGRTLTESTELGRKHKPDHVLLLSSLAISVIGLIVMFSISPAVAALSGDADSYYFSRHLLAFLIGVGASVVIAKLPTSWLKKLVITLAATSVILAGMVLVFEGLAFRWVKIGGMSFQPAELIKFTLILWLAFYLSDRMNSGLSQDWKKTLKPIAIVMSIVAFVIVILQRDLGSMVVLASIAGAMLLVSDVPLKPILMGGAIVLTLGALAIASTPYRRDRFTTFLNPERDCQNEGYHACQALIAVGSGGLVGLGVGNSVQAYGYLPETPTDSIFAVYAEKFGFVGSVLLVGLYGLVIQRMMRVLQRTADKTSRLLVAGVIGWIGVQSMINLGAMIGLLPLKGITLPLVSYGGSSLIFVMMALGVVYRISAYTSARKTAVITSDNRYNGNNENTSYGRRDRRTYNTPLSRR